MADCSLSGPNGDDGDDVLQTTETWIYYCFITAVAGDHPNTAGADSDQTSRITDGASYYGSSQGVSKSIIATDQEFTGLGEDSIETVAIGEQVTYQVVVTLPPGNYHLANMVDTMDVGLSFVDCLFITPSGAPGDLFTNVLGGFGSICDSPGLNPSDPGSV